MRKIVRTLTISTLLSLPSFSIQFYKCFNALFIMNYFDNILYIYIINELFYLIFNESRYLTAVFEIHLFHKMLPIGYFSSFLIYS